MTVIMYTDGACLGNPGPGGYAAVIDRYGEEPFVVEGGCRRTTNNRMELMAVIAGLSELRPSERVQVRSDSEYIVNAVNKGWAKRWKYHDWRRNKKDMALNPDLWDWLLELLEGRNVSFDWIKGHSGNAGNERADAIASAAASDAPAGVDGAYELGIFEAGGAATGRSRFWGVAIGARHMTDDIAVDALAERPVESDEATEADNALDVPFSELWTNRSEMDDGVSVVARLVTEEFAAEVHWTLNQDKHNKLAEYRYVVSGVRGESTAKRMCVAAARIGVDVFCEDERYFSANGSLGEGEVMFVVNPRYWREVSGDCYAIGMGGFIDEAQAKKAAERLLAAAEDGLGR